MNDDVSNTTTHTINLNKFIKFMFSINIYNKGKNNFYYQFDIFMNNINIYFYNSLYKKIEKKNISTL